MNKTTFKTKNLLLKPALIIGISIALFSSCSKKEQVDTPVGGDATVSISVGVTPEQEVKKAGMKMRSAAAAAKTANGETILKTETLKGKGIEMDVTTAEGYDYSFNDKPKTHKLLNKVQKMAANSSALKQSGINKLAADVPMNTGVKYWIAFFNKATQKFEHSQQAVAGTPLTLDVVKNQEYDWYAYSYDNTDDITALNATSGLVHTSTTAPFLFAKGVFKATASGNTPLSIVFEHQLQQIKFDIDTRGIFGDLSAVKVNFSQNSRTIPAFFDVRTGDFATFELGEENQQLSFQVVENDSERQLEARYYTADLTQHDYHFEVDQLEVTLPNGDVEDLVDLLPDNQLSFNFSTAGKGKIQLAKLNLWRVIPTKKILHLESNPTYGYGASAKASNNFLKDSRNFGPQSDYVRIQGFTTQTIGVEGDMLSNALADPTNYPDVIIAGVFFTFSDNDYNALETYLNRGGVVFLMTQDATTPTTKFFRKILNSQAITLSIHDIAGSVYKLFNVDSDVLAWPFGDSRNRYWGQDASHSLYINNIPEEEKENIIIYTESAANIYLPALQQPGGVTMFRHKNLSLFFVGDTGFLASELEWGQYPSTTIEPFATNINNFPVPHTKYGHSAASGSPEFGKGAGAWQVDNSVIFGNVFAHLISLAHYKPVDRSPF